MLKESINGDLGTMNSKMNVKKLIYFLCLFPLVKPAGLTYIQSFNTIFQVWKIVSLIFMSIYIVCHVGIVKRIIEGKYKFLHGLGGLVIFETIYVVNSIIREVECVDIINNCLTNIVLIVFLIVVYKSGKRTKLIESLSCVFILNIVFQAISMILERLNVIIFRALDGSPTYYLGPDNYSAFFTIPMIGLLLYFGYDQKNTLKFKTRDLILVFILTACYVWTGSVTAACSLLLLILILMFSDRRSKVIKFLSPKQVIFFLIILFILIVVFDIQNSFGNLLRFVGKEQNGFSLNSRTFIWANAINLIIKKPLMGYGNLSDAEISNYILYGASHAHNIGLELLLRTGIIGTLAYLYFVLSPIYRNKKRFFYTKAKVLLVSVTIYIILSFMDFYPLLQMPYLLFSIVYLSIDSETPQNTLAN